MRVQDGAASGSPEKIRQVENVSGGGAWNKPGTIVFAPGLTGGLSKAAAGGGTPQALTTLNAVRNEHAQPWPRVSAVRQSFHFFAALTAANPPASILDRSRRRTTRRLFASKTNAVYIHRPVGFGVFIVYPATAGLWASHSTPLSLQLRVTRALRLRKSTQSRAFLWPRFRFPLMERWAIKARASRPAGFHGSTARANRRRCERTRRPGFAAHSTRRQTSCGGQT